MPDTADADLMSAAATGDTGAFETLVRRHSGPLLQFITRIEGDAHRAEDVVQDCLLSVWKHRNQFDRVRGFKPWLYRIALNRSRELHRRKSLPIGDVPPAEVGGSSGDCPDACAVAVETASLVVSAVDELPPTQRAVVLLRIWEGLTYSDIAYSLAVTEGTARSHMYFALAGLRKALKHVE
jgi:RNA polymerase sigma-70 factor (ECF subfamily)